MNSDFKTDKHKEERDVILVVPAGGSNPKRFVAQLTAKPANSHITYFCSKRLS